MEDDSRLSFNKKRINLKKVGNFMSICWISCWFVRTAVILICFIYHVRFGQSSIYFKSTRLHALDDSNKTQPTNEEEAEADEVYLIRSRQGLAYDILFHFGSIYRELGMAGVYCFCCFTGIVIFHPYFPYFSHEFCRLCNKEFAIFLIDPERAKKLTTNRLRGCLSLAIHSNLNYTQAILDLMLAKLPYNLSNTRRETNDDAAAAAIISLKPSLEQLKQLNGQVNGRLGESKNMFNSSENGNPERLIKGLRQQYSYLIELVDLGEQSNCWPCNRRAPDRERMRREFLYSVSTTCSYVFILGMSAYLLAMNLAHKAIVGNQNLPKEMQKFSAMERFMTIDNFLFNYFASYWFTSQISMLLIILKNELKVIENLDFKFKQLNALVGEFNSLKREQQPPISSSLAEAVAEPTGGRSHANAGGGSSVATLAGECPMVTRLRHTGSSSSSSNFDGLNVDELGRKCDRLAVEIYVSFRMLLEQVDAPLEFARLIMLLSVLFVGYCPTVTLACFTQVRSSELLVLTILICLVIVIVNFGFFVCAAFSACAIKLSNSIFSLIASTLATANQATPTIEPHQQQQQQQPESSARFRFAPSIGYRLIRSELVHISADVNYLSGCAISPHTLLLWRRLASDLAPLEKRLFCTIAGFIQLKHRSILHFNFWVISAILLALIWIAR